MIKQALTTPKDVFDSTITTISKEVTKGIQLVSHDKATYTAENVLICFIILFPNAILKCLIT